MTKPRSKITKDSKVKYFEEHKEIILATLHYMSTAVDLSDDNKARLADAYLNITSDDNDHS